MIEHDLTTHRLPVADLHLFARNAHVGNVPRIEASMRINGVYKPVVVNRGTHTGRPNEVLCGNHTLIAARNMTLEHLSGVLIDVDEDQCSRINLADNPREGHPEDLSYDVRLLLEQLESLEENLEGTGYDPGDVDDLIAALEEAERGELGPRASTDLEGRLANYEHAGTHTIILVYSNAVFGWAVEKLGELAEARGLDSNAQVVLSMIADACGEQPPAADSEDADADDAA